MIKFKALQLPFSYWNIVDSIFFNRPVFFVVIFKNLKKRILIIFQSKRGSVFKPIKNIFTGVNDRFIFQPNWLGYEIWYHMLTNKYHIYRENIIRYFNFDWSIDFWWVDPQRVLHILRSTYSLIIIFLTVCIYMFDIGQSICEMKSFLVLFGK